jgi:NADPH-dependent curcumin reductase CurA
MSRVNRRIVLASRPSGAASAENFRLESVPIPEPGDGQVLIRHHYLSLDPYMRGRMSDRKSYAAPQPLDEVMIGGTVGEVLASRFAGLAVGDTVVSMGGWQEYSVGDSKAGALAPRKVDARRIPLPAFLGIVGMPGVTGWYGLNRICEPKSGETVAVSAATGAVGSVVGQLAKQQGCRVVGVAGGREKCAYATQELGFDACVDYKTAKDARALGELLAAAAPAGVDCYFENVGGVVLDAVLTQMNAFGRIAVCGMISNYDGEPIALAYPSLILTSRLMLQGFIVAEHPEIWPQALGELGAGVASGKLKYRETIADGLERAPEAFLGLLKGRNLGKQLVKLI